MLRVSYFFSLLFLFSFTLNQLEAKEVSQNSYGYEVVAQLISIENPATAYCGVFKFIEKRTYRFVQQKVVSSEELFPVKPGDNFVVYVLCPFDMSVSSRVGEKQSLRLSPVSSTSCQWLGSTPIGSKDYCAQSVTPFSFPTDGVLLPQSSSNPPASTPKN